ncbi:DNA-binding transcriptional ArsR family regulator [Kibdelosporangium banguiense]|uniref:DNA-binding transcriptional ArsR family regulator n=1 Tax=Kibdelosporangium banguiense TaxID=1365924 RepID=A0ABS4TLV0_9PSEU|nr:winged helix-turn-helix domain-containing protein [Kibdelosporangium banguiense]MBP2324984.1 DNA-binding transcriptional ArsR family regulator [Kibdelosporangium banguiense]
MLRIYFTPEDLTRTRISAAQPMWEILLSLYRLRQRKGAPVHEEWRRSVVTKTPVTTRLLTDLVPQSGYAVDFLTPMTNQLSLADGLEAIRSTPKRRLRKDLAILAGGRQLPSWTTSLADGRKESVVQLADAVDRYFASCLAPYWDRISGRINQERATQAKLMADGGFERLVQALHPTARWHYPVLEMGYPVEHELHLGGRGLQLVPSFFCQGLPTTFLDGDFEPVLVYPIQHRPGWSAVDGSRGSLASLLGRTRAKVLEAIGESPCTTSEVARRTDTTLSTASQQASMLRAAGLVTSRQNGQSMLHTVTSLGLALMAGSFS